MIPALALAGITYALMPDETKAAVLDPVQPPVGDPNEAPSSLWEGMNPFMQPPNLQTHSIGTEQVHYPYNMDIDGFVAQNPLGRQLAEQHRPGPLRSLDAMPPKAHESQRHVYDEALMEDLPFTGFNDGVAKNWRLQWARSVAAQPQTHIAEIQGIVDEPADIPLRWFRGGILGPFNEEKRLVSWGFAPTTPLYMVEPGQPIKGGFQGPLPPMFG